LLLPWRGLLLSGLLLLWRLLLPRRFLLLRRRLLLVLVLLLSFTVPECIERGRDPQKQEQKSGADKSDYFHSAVPPLSFRIAN
jgi:hypothetical protein